MCLGLSFAQAIQAGPWIAPGDSALRSDIQLLGDAGIIRASLMTWPLSWGDVMNSIDESAGSGSPAEIAALARLRRRAAKETVIGEAQFNAYGSASKNPVQIRSFEDVPREDAEIGIGFKYTGDWFATSLQGQWVSNPDDGDDFRFDDSYVGLALGNWMLSVSTLDRWWGPGWQSSLILSSNARPVPSIMFERNGTDPFKTKWLKWIGHWDLTVMYGFLEEERVVPNAHLFAMRFEMRPLNGLQIGLSRSGMWCGDGQPCGADAFLDMLFRGDDGTGTSNPNQLGGWDARWSDTLFDQPFALYGQFIGEDENGFFPTNWLGQMGGETWGHWDKLGTWRLILEWSDTECNFRLYSNLRGLFGDEDKNRPGCAYNHNTYETGYRYKGRSIGHSFDSDSSVFTFGGVLSDNTDNSWFVTFAIGNLNRRNAVPNTVAENKTRYRDLELVHRRDLWIGKISIGLGYDYRKDTLTNVKNDQFRGFLEYGVGY